MKSPPLEPEHVLLLFFLALLFGVRGFLFGLFLLAVCRP